MNKNLKIFSLFILVTTCLFFSSCSNEKTTSTSEKTEKPTIAVSIVPEESFVKAIAGDLVEVVTMIPSGQSPENFQPTPDLLEKFSNSKLYFSIGVPTENSSILPKAKDLNPDLKIINLDQEVAKTFPHREFSPGEKDHHIWLSPKRVKIMLNIIQKELSEIDPSNKAIYEKNTIEYTKKLDEADNKIKSSLTSLKNKSIIVYHPAFGYFCDEYGLNMIALEEEGKESHPQNLQEIIDMAKEKGIKTIFYQAEIDNKQAKTFADEINGEAELIAPLSPDYIENLEKMAEAFKKVASSQ